MSARGETDFASASSYRRGFFFWSLAPFLVLFLFVMPFCLVTNGEVTFWRVVGVGGVEAVALALLLVLFNPIRFWWAGRLVGAGVFLAYLLYMIAMIVEQKFVGQGRRAETTLFNAALGMIVFGLPGLCFAIFGRVTWRTEPDDIEYDDEDFGDDDPDDQPDEAEDPANGSSDQRSAV